MTPLLTITTVVAIQVAIAAFRAPLPVVLVEPPTASLASSRRKRSGPALVATAEVAVPQRAVVPRKQRV